MNEIGEGVTPFPFRRIGVTKVDSWMADMSMADKSKSVTGRWEQLPSLQYEFKGDKATYITSIAAGYSRRLNINFGRKPGAPTPPDYNMIIVVSFDVKDRTNPNDEPQITNYGEQFKVLSTVVAITKQVIQEISEIKWVELMEIRIAPKLEDEEEGKPITQSKRGRFYLEYIKKQGANLPGDWTAEVANDMFVLHPRKMSSTNPDKYINL